MPGEQDDAVLEAEDPADGEPDDPVTIAGSWGTAKKWARDTIYADHNTTFYCGCSYAKIPVWRKSQPYRVSL